MSLQLTQKQKQILKNDILDPAKITISEGSVRSGKTFLNNVLFYKELRKHKNKNFIITGFTTSSVKRNVLDSFEDMFGVQCRPNLSGTFNLFGNKIHIFGSDKQDSYKSLTGMTCQTWYGNEVSLSHKNSVQECFNRCSENNSRIIWDSNPSYPHHFIKTDFIDRSGERLNNGKLRIKSYHYILDDNNFLSPEYIENLKLSTPQGMWYNRSILGLWSMAEGLVYESFNPDLHCIEPFDIPAEWTKVRGVDFGYNNPFITLWVAIDPDNRLYVYNEYYKNKTLLNKHAEKIKSIKGTFKWTVADHDAQDVAELKKYGVKTKPAIKNVAIGLQRVASRLIVQNDGKPRLFIFNNCVQTRKEFTTYHWMKVQDNKAAREEPDKVLDHCMDVIRYIVMQIDNKRNLQLFL